MKKINSVHDDIIKHLLQLKKDRDYRNAEQSVLLEGKNTILDYAKKHKIQTLLQTKSMDFDIPAQKKYIVSDHIIEKLASSVSPEGIIAEVALPEFVSLSKKKCILCLANIQDPGNMGTLLRSALALGFDGVYCIEPCCDPFNEKALRAAKGATFDLALQKGSWDEFQKLVQEAKFTVYAADLEGEPLKESVQEPLALLLGNEAQGILSPENFDMKKITIPMQSGVNSLNVAAAGAIFMYLLRSYARKR